MSKTFTTPKGSVVPLTNLKGKDYLMVAYRLIWLNEEVEQFTIDTEFLLLTDEQTVAKANIVLYDKDGKVMRAATATKRETKKDFPDHTEKAETSAIGRCLALLGFGTQFAIADIEEGDRLADSPVQTKETPKKATFRKPTVVATQTKPEIAVEAVQPVIPLKEVEKATANDGWE